MENWVLIPIVLFGIAIWQLDTRIKKVTRRLDDLSDELSERFNIEV